MRSWSKGKLSNEEKSEQPKTASSAPPTRKPLAGFKKRTESGNHYELLCSEKNEWKEVSEDEYKKFFS